MRKVLTLSAVKYAALLLIESNSSTTTLDVKELLRALDYESSQSDVSDLLQQASSELPLEFTTTGMYRVYTLPTPASVAPSVAAPSSVASSGTNTTQSNVLTYTSRDGTTLIGSLSNVTTDIGDWCVTSTTGATDKFFCVGTHSRDRVRQAYAHLFQVKYSDTRAKRITD